MLHYAAADLSAHLKEALVKKPILLAQALTMAAAFALLGRVLGAAGLWFALGLLLAAPTVVSLRSPSWLGAARAASLVGLLAIVVGATADLWTQLLNQQRVDASLHLLVLALGLLLAVGHHLLQILGDGSPERENSASALLEAALRGPPITAMLCLSLVLGGAVLAYLYAFTGAISEAAEQANLILALKPKLLERGVIPPITLTLFLWGMALLAGKWLLVSRELRHSEAPDKRSLFDQAVAAHRGGTGQGGNGEFNAVLWQQFEVFYTLPRYIGWAIPILGFIGTVLGISLAAEGLGELLSSSEVDFSQSLGQALKPLGIAFDTTLVALSLSVVFALCQTLLYRWEERRLLKLAEGLHRR